MKLDRTVSDPLVKVIGVWTVPTPPGAVVRLMFTEKPPRSGCEETGVLAPSSRAAVMISGVCPAPTVVLKEGPNGPESAKPDGPSSTVAVGELNPEALAV